MSSVQPRPVTLRTAGWEDLDLVMGVMEHAFDSEFGEAWTRAQCAGILPMHGVRLVLAGHSQPQGFSLSRTVVDEAELLLLAVDPGVQRSGVGSALMDRFIEDAGSAGAHRLHLEVRDGNPAVALYKRYGFEVEGRRPNYYRGKDGCFFDALTMGRDI